MFLLVVLPALLKKHRFNILLNMVGGSTALKITRDHWYRNLKSSLQSRLESHLLKREEVEEEDSGRYHRQAGGLTLLVSFVRVKVNVGQFIFFPSFTSYHV